MTYFSFVSGNYTGIISGGGMNESEQVRYVKEEEASGMGLLIGVTVSIIVLLAAVIAVGAYILWRRARPQKEIKKVLVHNDMNDPNPPAQPSGADGRVTLSKLKAHFSKSKLNNDTDGSANSDVTGVTNPVYMDDRNKGIIMEETTSIEQPHSPVGFDM